jgi:hypothetical protein
LKTLSVTDVARNFRAVLDALERDQEEIVQGALNVFGDLYRTLDDETADAVSAAIASQRKSRRGRVAKLRNPWAG